MARETTRKTASEVWQEAKNEQFAQDVKKVNSDYLAMYDKAVSGFVNNSRKNSPYDPYRSRSLAQEALSDIAYREQVIEAYYEKNRRRLGEDQYSAGLRKLASNRSSAQNVMGAYNAAAAFYPQQQKVDDYLERAMSYYNSAQTDLDSMTWANASDVYGRRSSAADALKAENDAFLEWLEKNRVTLGEQNYNSLKQQLEDIGSGYDDVVSAFGNNADFYGQFDTEDDYLKWDAYSTPEKRQATYQQNMDRLDVLREERRKIQGRVNTYRAGTNPYASGASNQNQSSSTLPDYKSDIQKLDAIDKEINALEEEISMSEDYERSARYADYMQKYSGKSYNELLSLLPDIKDEEEREWVSQYAPSVMTMLDYNSSIENAAAEIDSLEKVINEYNIITSGYGLGGEEEDKKINSEATKFLNIHGFRNIKEAEIRLEELKTTQWDLSNRKKYAFLDTNQDFDTIAGDIADSRTAGFGIGFGTNWWGFGDPVYDYINDIDGTRKEYVDTSDVQHPYTIYDMMYDDEIMKYNYLYNTEGKDSADKYLDYLEYTLNERRMGIARENAAILANKHPFAASALSVPYNLMSGIGFADIAGQNLLKNIAEGLTGEYIPVDYNSGAMGATVFNSTVRGTVAQNIANKHGVIELDKQAHPILSKVFNGKSLGDVYQLGMSMADSATTALLAPVIGTGATALLGGSAASQGVLDAVSRGATDEQALMMGIVNGACEMFFEKYSLEQLLKGDTRNIVMAFLKQGFAEGSEEFNTTVANNLADIFIMAKNSDYQRNVDKYIDQGLSPEEAEKMAFWDAAIQAGWDFVGGFASGGIMGSAAAPIQNYQNQNAEAFRIYGADPGALVSEALEIDPDNAYAQKMQNRLEAGKQLSGGQLNRLVKQNEAALSAQDIYTIQSAAEARLTDLGETGDVSSIAAALTKQATGRKLTRAEQKVIENSKYGQRVANELNTDNIQSGGFSSAWVENIGTNRINAQEYNRPAEAAQLPQKAVKNTGDSKILSPKATPVEAPAETVPANRDSADDIDGLETTYPVSEDGKAHLISNPEQSVDIVGFSSAKDGKVMLRTSDGEVVPADDVSYSNESQAIVFETIASMGIKAKSANILLQGFLGKEGIDAEAYARGLLEAFEYGKANRNTSGMSFSSALTPAQLDYVYRQGRKAAKKQTGREQARMIQTVERARAVIDQRGDSANAEYTVILEDGLTEEEMTPSQKASYEMIRHIPAAMKGNVRIYDGKTGEFGYYDPKSGDIYLNINSTRSQKSMMAFAMGHELVHRAKDGSPAKYQKFADFLIEQYGKQGSDVEAMIAEQKQAAKDHGLELTDEQAFDEVVADACQRMLLDTNAGQRLSEFGVQSKQNQSIVQDVIQWIRDILEKLRNIFADVDPDSLAAQEFAKFDASVKQILADMYVDMTIDAGENLAVIKKAFGSDTQVSKMENKLDAAEGKYRLKQLQEQGASFMLPKGNNPYTYDALTSKPDMAVITLPTEVTTNRNDVVDIAKKNAASIGRIDPKTGAVSVYVKDIGGYVGIGRDGLKHSTDRRSSVNAPVVVKAGEIISNSIRINELTPKKDNVDESYVLIGAARNAKNEMYVIRSVVNRFTHNLVSMDVLYAINAKKEPAALLPLSAEQSALGTDSKISIAKMFDYVNKYFPDILPEEVLKHYGHEYRPSGELGERALYKLPVNEDTSPRALLTNALDSVITDPVEKQKLQEYRENIEKLNEQEDKLRDLKSQIKDLSFAPGPRDTQKIKALREEAAKTENRINIYDKRLLRFEASSTLQKVLQREKAKVAEREKAKRIKGKEDYQRGEEVKLAELIRKYRATREALTQQKLDTTTMEAEFIRLVKQYEKLSAKSNASNKTSKDKLSDLRTALKEEAKAHKDDQKQWEKEFDRLLKEYEHSEKRIDLLEAKIKAQRKSASARVDSRNRTEMRKKIRRVIRDLDKLLNRGTKKQNVKEGMRDFVAAALASAEALFTETYTTEDMISYGVKTDTTAEERKLLAMAKRILDQISNLPKVADVDDVNALMKQEADLKKELSAVKSQLKGVFERERYRMSGFTASKLFGELANSYANLAKSGDNYISGAYREEIYQRLLETQTAIGAVRVADMSLEQLAMVYDSYAMVLQAVRDANKMFVFGRNVTRDDLARSVLSELKNAIKAKKNISKAGKLLNSFAWNNLKPIYAFERIGSSTLAELYANIRKGQDVWALDMREADKFRRSMYDKYHREGWDMDKKYTFKSSTGLEFSLNLEQIMSLYAYSKRAQAHDHLLKGGIVFDADTKITEIKNGIRRTYLVDDATTYKISDETLADIVATLNTDQKAFVDEMQNYLSTTMGNKGNQISMKMYGIKLFKEQYYFPLRSAGQFTERAREADLQREQGQTSLSNSGFTYSTVQNASNPVILSTFMDVWSGHVNNMSNYHAFVLPLEDFRRVYNYKTANIEGQDSVSVYQTIQNAHGTAATAYIDQLYRDLNGGVVADPRENIAKKMIGLFKQGAVMASSSVVIQQTSALVRSFAMIDPKYFGALPIVRGAGRVLTDKVHHQHQQLWEELKKYAPVAIIKEMGYFDTGMGRSAVDFLQTEEYHGFGEKAKGFFTDSDYRGEVLSKAAAKADELTWIQIWIAVKNETADRNPGMNRNSEEFLKIAGERFSEVIDRTQVYDSVFARSGNMRSKSVFMNIATAFKAEPTTSINMIEDAIRKFGKGYKGQAARTIGAVFLNILLNSALVSLIYAARDDDEDETYLEKYVSSFVTESMDGLNPMTYYPFLNDVWSILQGYDVERADLSLVTDVVDVMKNLVKLHAKDTSGMEEEKLAEHNKQIRDAWLKALDGMTAFMGLPVKNVRRDFNGAINMYKTLSADFGGRTTTIQSIGDVLQSDVSKSVPVLGWLPQKTKADKLFDALVSGDTAYIDRLKATYKDEDAYKSAIRTVIGERFVNGKIGANEASRYLVLHGGLDGSEARGYIDEWSMEIDVGIVYDDLRKQFVDQKVTESEAVDYLVKYGGKREEDAEKTVREWGLEKDTGIPYAKMKEVFLDRGISESEAVDYMVEYGGKKRDAAEETVNKWRLELETGIAYEEMKTKFIDEDISESEAVDYMVEYGGKKQKDAEAIVKQWTFEKETGIAYDDMKTAFIDEKITESEAVKYRVEYGGAKQEDAEKTVSLWKFESENGWDYDNRRSLYLDGEISAATLKKALIKYGDMEPEDADLQVQAYNWEAEGYENVTTAAVRDYNEYCAASNVPKDIYMHIRKFANSTENDVVNGEEVTSSAVKKIMREINAQQGLTPAQKTALARSIPRNWKDSTIEKYKLW